MTVLGKQLETRLLHPRAHILRSGEPLPSQKFNYIPGGNNDDRVFIFDYFPISLRTQI
ncbi:hypothetical protein LCGC14_2105310 [marine sediment metagenome]|uniref:Uncharacterized protein n=1 Tax=marine sediment metagenome TaxID=412755 RepID=A0A0F9GLW3_9ZZZZ